MATLSESREAFLANMCKLSGASERPQFQAILDDFIGWSAARPDDLAYHDKDHRPHLVSFRFADSSQLIWTAYPKMNAGAKLSVLPGGNGRLTDELLAEIVAKLQGVTTEPVRADKKLDIPFRALKSPARRAVVKEVIDTILSEARPALA